MNRLRLLLLICIVCLFGVSLTFALSQLWFNGPRPAAEFIPDRPITIPDSRGLATLFDALAYPWPLAPHAQIPPVEIAIAPRDLAQLPSHRERKALFLRILLPIVLMHNEQLLKQRDTVQSLYQTLQSNRAARMPGGMVSRSLVILLTEYQIDSDAPLDSRLEELLLRLDVVPPSLVLAQAAVESDWGRSAAAQQANNLFNKWLTDTGPSGRRFDRLSESVAAYMRFLNTADVFSEFRKAREIMRIEGRDFESHTLAGLIAKHAKRTQRYARKLRRVIHGSELLRLDGLELRAREAVIPQV